ncbi:MAG: hypothetical protein ACOCZ9_03595 [Spirochaetota bacterium]
MEFKERLYAIFHPNDALVASQLTPEQFARHYTSGSAQHYHGKVIFGELASTFRDSFFPIEEVLEQLEPHDDGRPKATKFISTYRVLEHIDVQAIRKLYLATQDGACIGLEPGEYQNPYEEGFVRIYAEIAPMRMLVLSDFDFTEFGAFITDPKNYKSAPKQLYTQLNVNIVEFLEEYEHNQYIDSPIRVIHPASLRAAFNEVRRSGEKRTKGLCVDSSLDEISYRLIRHGFMFASQFGTRFFPMPPLSEIEATHERFRHSM